MKLEVLFIGNSTDVKSKVQAWASEAGLVCKTRKDITSGLNASKDGQIVVVDCDISGGTSEECIEALNKLNNGIVTLALFEASSMEKFKSLLRTDAWFYIPKPVDDEILKKSLERAKTVLMQLFYKEKENIEEFFSAKLENCLENLNQEPGFSLYDTVLGEAERALFSLVLKKTKGNKSRASKLLGINRNTLNKKVKKYGL